MGILDTPRRDTELALVVALDLAVCDAVLVLKDEHQKLRSAVVLVPGQLEGLPRKTGGLGVRGSVIDGGVPVGRRKSRSVGGVGLDGRLQESLNSSLVDLTSEGPLSQGAA
jgi:hypothetical protein